MPRPAPAVRTRWNPFTLSARAVVSMAAFIWIFVKLPQEWWIHIAKLDFTEFMADHGYNQPGGYSYHHCADLQITADPAKPIDKGWPGQK